MLIKTRLSKVIIFVVAAAVASLFAVFSVGAQERGETQLQPPAQETIFDVAEQELGCSSKKECKTLCAQPEYFQRCSDFSRAHNLRPDQNQNGDARHSGVSVDRLLAILRADGGPDGQCGNEENPIKACSLVCQTPKQECVTYATQHGIFTEPAARMASAVLDAAAAGDLPQGCTQGEAACQRACENPDRPETAVQCFKIAQRLGQAPQDLDEEKVKKIFEDIKQGRAPFTSVRDFGVCERPENQEILEKCVKFGVEHGLIPEEKAAIIRRTGGRGPGECQGQEECRAFCENPEHEDACMRFAEEHDLIPPEQKARMQEGMQRFREGFNRMPPEVGQCLKNAVGTEVIDRILAGDRPTQRVGEAMRTCAQSFRQREEEGAPHEEAEVPATQTGASTQFPPEVRACLERAGIAVERIQGRPSTEMESIMRTCFEQMRRTQQTSPQDNQQPRFEGPSGTTPGTFVGPGGCTTAQECRTFCQAYPGRCQRPGVTPQPAFPNVAPEPRSIPTQLHEPSTLEPHSLYPAYPQQGYPRPGEFIPPQGQYPQNSQPYYYTQPTAPSDGTLFPPYQPAPGVQPFVPPSSRLSPPTLLGFFSQLLFGIER